MVCTRVNESMEEAERDNNMDIYSININGTNKQLQRVAPSMPRAKTTDDFGAWGCVWWLSVRPYAGEAPCSQVLPSAYNKEVR